MSALRAARATRLVPTINRAQSGGQLVSRRFASSKDPADNAADKNQDAALVRQPEPKQALVDHGGLDYAAHVDFGTSKFSPVPRRVMDGSEPGDVVPAAVLSGAPAELQARTVRIYKPAKTATQSGNWNSHHWRMDWDILQKGHRWENPLMGWQASADGMQGTHLNFRSKEEAIMFAQKQGYEYFVQEPNIRKFAPKAYASQFMYIPGKVKQVRTK